MQLLFIDRPNARAYCYRAIVLHVLNMASNLKKIRFCGKTHNFGYCCSGMFHFHFSGSWRGRNKERKVLDKVQESNCAVMSHGAVYLSPFISGKEEGVEGLSKHQSTFRRCSQGSQVGLGCRPLLLHTGTQYLCVTAHGQRNTPRTQCKQLSTKPNNGSDLTATNTFNTWAVGIIIIIYDNSIMGAFPLS